MKDEETTVLEVLTRALEESEGETVDIVIENELPGITQQMYEWWGRNMGQTRLYKMWHPDHISFEVEETSDSGRVAHPKEKIGPYAPTVMSFHPVPNSEYPVTPIYKNYRCSAHLTEDNRRLSMLCGEYEEGENGLKIKQVFRFPAKTPQKFLDALRQHVTEEVRNFPKFLPELYAKEGKG